MTDTSPAAVATRYFTALAGGDVPAAMGLLSPEVAWHQPGANRFSGTHHGQQGVGALLGGMMETSQGSFQLAVTGPAMVNGDLVAVPVRFTGRRESEAMDMAGIDLLRIVNGLIIAVHLFSEDQAVEDRFWNGV